MNINDLNVTTNRKPKRVGRGISAGQGKTAGRGTKGQRSRAGSGRKPGFEGGQNPLYKRIPKLRGFTPIKRYNKVTITTQSLNQFTGTVDNFTLYEAQIINNPSDFVRVVYRGDVSSAVAVHLQGASKKAIESIVAAGGSYQKTDRVKQTSAQQDTAN